MLDPCFIKPHRAHHYFWLFIDGTWQFFFTFFGDCGTLEFYLRFLSELIFCKLVMWVFVE
jgi:hypothetical protein